MKEKLPEGWVIIVVIDKWGNIMNFEKTNFKDAKLSADYMFHFEPNYLSIDICNNKGDSLYSLSRKD